jgi:hypothetical protein
MSPSSAHCGSECGGVSGMDHLTRLRHLCHGYLVGFSASRPDGAGILPAAGFSCICRLYLTVSLPFYPALLL